MKSYRHAFLLSSLLLAANCLILVLIPTANAALILNGSFEFPDAPTGSAPFTYPYTFSGTPAEGWSESGGIGNSYIVDNTSTGLSYPAAQDGVQYYQSASGISSWRLFQTFTIAPSAAGDYLLSWFDSKITGSSTSYFVDYDGLGGGTSFGFFPSDTWTSRSLALTLDAGDYTLTFGGLFAQDSTFLDDVRLEVTPVPEPPTIIAVGLLLLPIGITILRTLRKTRTSKENV